ncbi:TonB-dependent siderophore receptor [Novosphingobium sp. BL-52-GroH]|uniref:TonB-dependent siderophore receptor n=1 Tax=Novosphingobium sp. BL-52-GroH TaxID=3349877 RepID=UPI0038513836
MIIALGHDVISKGCFMGVIQKSRAVQGNSLLALTACAAALAVGSIAVPNAALAQTASARQFDLDIPAQDLNTALLVLTQRASLQIVYEADKVAGRRSTAVKGRMAPIEALSRLLTGSGLTFRMTGANRVTIEQAPQAADSAIQLGPVRVEGDSAAGGSASLMQQSASVSPPGYVATRTATGSKTDTSILDVPQTVNVVTRDEMDDRGVTDFNAAIAYTPGIRAVDYPGGQGSPDIYIRGFRAFNLYGLYKDGLRSGFNQYDTDIEQFAYERIDILKGPASILYGQAAPGGLVNLITKRPTEKPYHELQLEGGRFGRKQVAADVSGSLSGDGALTYRLTGLYRDSGTQIDHSPDDRIYIAPALTWKPADGTSLTVRGNYQRTVKGGAEQSLPMVGTIFPYTTRTGRFPSSLFLGEPGITRYEVNNYTIEYDFSQVFGEWTFRQNARYSHADVDYVASGYRSFTETTATFGFQKRPKTTDSFLIDSNVAGTVMTGTIEHNLIVGLDYGQYDGKESRRGATNHVIDIANPVYGAPVVWNVNLTTDTRSRVVQTGIYAQDQLKLGGWVLSIGGRQDWVGSKDNNYLASTLSKADDHAFTGRVGLIYQFENGLAPYVSYSTSFQPSSGVDFSGNSFKPTTGRQWEGGLKYQPLGFNGLFTASLFEITQRNVTTTDPVNSGYSIQEGEVRSRGFEFEGKANLLHGLNLMAAYSYTDAIVTEDNANASGISKVGSRMASVPHHQASAWLDHAFDRGFADGLKLGGGVRYIGSSMGVMNTTSGIQYDVPGYTLFDAAISYDFGRQLPGANGLTLTVSGTNLTDKRYFTPGFYYNSVFYGNRRAINARLSYRW